MSDRAHRRKLGQNYLIDPVILFEIERAINPQKNNLFFDIISRINIKSKIIIPKFNVPVPIKKSMGSAHSKIIAQKCK